MISSSIHIRKTNRRLNSYASNLKCVQCAAPAAELLVSREESGREKAGGRVELEERAVRSETHAIGGRVGHRSTEHEHWPVPVCESGTGSGSGHFVRFRIRSFEHPLLYFLHVHKLRGLGRVSRVRLRVFKRKCWLQTARHQTLRERLELFSKQK